MGQWSDWAKHRRNVRTESQQPPINFAWSSSLSSPAWSQQTLDMIHHMGRMENSWGFDLLHSTAALYEGGNVLHGCYLHKYRQRQRFMFWPWYCLESRSSKISQPVKSSMLSQCKTQQQYANHLQDLARSYKYFSFELNIHQAWRSFIALKFAFDIVWPVLVSWTWTAKETTVARTFLWSKFWRQATRFPL